MPYMNIIIFMDSNLDRCTSKMHCDQNSYAKHTSGTAELEGREIQDLADIVRDIKEMAVGHVCGSKSLLSLESIRR